MQLVRGPTLAALALDGVLGAERALGLLAQVAGALDAAHAAGLVHRDVKPKNVLVANGDHAYLADFGLTRLGGDSGATVTGHLVGTLAYLAPEVIEGRPATAASDVYAFAAMVFECLSGGPVFPRPTQAALLYAHTSEPPPAISGRRPELPSALDPVLERALAKTPAERPGSAVELMDSVRTALEGVDLAELGPPPPPETLSDDTTVEPLAAPARAPRERRRGRTAAIVLASLAAGAAIGGTIALLAGDDGAAKASAPGVAKGATVLGSDLGAPGATRDCRGRPVRASSVACTIAQAALPGGTLVVPQAGVVRRWAVRSAIGELSLAVLRPSDDGFVQITVSRNEFVSNDGVTEFATELAVEPGDILALQVRPGSGVGARASDGATTNRWIPPVGPPRKPDLGPRSGFDDELLLRVELVPGAEKARPRQVTGAAAATLPDGKVVKRSRLRFTNGTPVEYALVDLGDHFALDYSSRGRRLARQDLPPDFHPQDGRVITWEVENDDSEDAKVGIYVEYVNGNSARILSHYADAYESEFDFVD